MSGGIQALEADSQLIVMLKQRSAEQVSWSRRSWLDFSMPFALAPRFWNSLIPGVITKQIEYPLASLLQNEQGQTRKWTHSILLQLFNTTQLASLISRGAHEVQRRKGLIQGCTDRLELSSFSSKPGFASTGIKPWTKMCISYKFYKAISLHTFRHQMQITAVSQWASQELGSGQSGHRLRSSQG